MSHPVLKKLTPTPQIRIGLGMAALGRPGYITLSHADDLPEDRSIESMENHAHTILDAAWQAGVRYFDAARSYGQAEQFLGTWLKSRQIAPENVAVGSKWGYIYTADWQIQAEKHEVKDHSLEVLKRQWVETQEYLGDYLNLYQIHSATLQSGVLENAEVLTELARLKAEGTLIGLTLSGPNQGEVLEKALQVTIESKMLFDSVQVTWNLLEKAATEALKAAHDAGIGIIVKEVLANGRLTPANANPAFSSKRDLLNTQVKRLNTTIDALALAAVLTQPWAGIVLSGAARLDHLRSNMRAALVQWDDAAEDALASLVEPAADYWQTRSDLQWQ